MVLSVCRHCSTPIEWMPGIGWIDSLGGDEGGTYDICPLRELDKGHEPAR